MSSQKLVDVRDAALKTVAVEVRVLTIGGKQVTLSVFRQLPEDNVLDYCTAKLRGVPWGIVNYHPDELCQQYTLAGGPRGRNYSLNAYDSHIHVVWQDGTLLKRSLVQTNRYFRISAKIKGRAVADIDTCPACGSRPVGDEWTAHAGIARRWQKEYDKLAALDQLFIAV